MGFTIRWRGPDGRHKQMTFSSARIAVEETTKLGLWNMRGVKVDESNGPSITLEALASMAMAEESGQMLAGLFGGEQETTGGLWDEAFACERRAAKLRQLIRDEPYIGDTHRNDLAELADQLDQRAALLKRAAASPGRQERMERKRVLRRGKKVLGSTS
ncbi:MAG: hypothetical protein AB7U95_32820 [Reyranella sp.]